MYPQDVRTADERRIPAPEEGASGFVPSVPHTPAQAVLRVVSIIMALLGAVVVAGGVLALVAGTAQGGFQGHAWAVVSFGVIVLVAAGLLLVTAFLGLRAADDAAKVEPYRFLCYLVGLVVLVAIVWAWGMGTFILFNPVVLATTVFYVLICSTLADKVKDEREHGVRGESFLRSRHQRTLHLLAEVLLVKGSFTAIVLVILFVLLMVNGSSGTVTVAGTDFPVGDGTWASLAANAVVCALNLVMGLLGVRGSNRPQRIGPFLALSCVSCAYEAAQAAAACAEQGSLAALSADVLIDLLFSGACVYLSVRVARQPAAPAASTPAATQA